MKRFALLSAVFAGVAVLPATSSAIWLNELGFNPPGTDGGFEFFEIAGDAGASLNGLTLVVIEGDGAPAAGTIDQALSLNGLSIGSNGLFLWRDAATNIPWRDSSDNYNTKLGPAAGTTVHVADFNPDIENGSNTYLLVRNFTGSVGTDLDAENDGMLDSRPWDAIVDGVGVQEEGTAEITYSLGLDLPGFGQGLVDQDGGFYSPDGLIRMRNVAGNPWLATDMLSLTGGLLGVDPSELTLTNGADPRALPRYEDWTFTPGGVNPVPEPGTMLALGLGAAALASRRRNRK